MTSKQVLNLIEKYQKILKLDSTIIRIAFCDKLGDAVAEVVKTGEITNEFTIFFDNKALNNKDIKDTIVHEMTHIFLWNYTDVAESTLRVMPLSKETRRMVLAALYTEEHELLQNLVEILI